MIIWQFVFVLIPSIDQRRQSHPSVVWGYEKQIHIVVNRIITGQSSAIISFFSEERTSILGYLRNENLKQRCLLYGDEAETLIFSYLDIAFIEQTCSPFQFWETVLEPLREKMVADSQLAQAYQEAKDSQFKTFELDYLIGLVNKQGWRLVLLLDRFESLLQHPHFKENWEFFTTLRQLAVSRTPTSLVLVIASNQSLEQFHQQIQPRSPATMPVLNFVKDMTISGLSEQAVDELLIRNQPALAPDVHQFIKKMAGGHPYLLDLAIKAFLNKKQSSFEVIENAFYEQVKPMIASTIKKSWSSRMCEAYLTLMEQRKILEGFENELQQLEWQGVVMRHHGVWQNTMGVVTRFMTDHKDCHNYKDL